MFIDSHAHLEGKRYDADRDEVLARAKQNGIEAYLAIGNGEGPATADCGFVSPKIYDGQAGISRRIWASVGVHPHEASLANEMPPTPKCCNGRGIPKSSPGEKSASTTFTTTPRATFRKPSFRQMELAKTAKLPIIIHCRPSDNSENAWDDCLAMIAEHWTSTGLGGILHCFTGSVEHARRALDMGFMISFAGNITFPKAQAIRDAAQIVPLDRMLIETDSPYLAPIPHRGQRNEPAFVREVARQIGELRNLCRRKKSAREPPEFLQILQLAPLNVILRNSESEAGIASRPYLRDHADRSVFLRR
jgi:TatD DNase family protein